MGQVGRYYSYALYRLMVLSLQTYKQATISKPFFFKTNALPTWAGRC